MLLNLRPLPVDIKNKTIFTPDDHGRNDDAATMSNYNIISTPRTKKDPFPVHHMIARSCDWVV